ncbi:hypothetical protein [Neisseria sp.]|uniref:DUF6985 domain-containing protein n=1 Tax=Neisseria sp. TaxID=192066 RepID=UPI00359F4911
MVTAIYPEIPSLNQRTIYLPRWADFRFARKSGRPSDFQDGYFKLAFLGSDGLPAAAITPECRAAYLYAIRYESDIQTAVLHSLLTETYPAYRQVYRETAPELMATVVPEISNPDDLKPLLSLAAVHLHSTGRNGLAYCGYEFRCSWDEEHHFGILMSGCEIVDIGGADVAMMPAECLP